MWYRKIPPHNRPRLDARVTAILITILGLSCLPYIQVYPAFRSYVIAYLSRGIDAGLPSRLFTVPLCLIVSEISGRIQFVYVEEGATVHTGDPLIQLETREIVSKKLELESLIHSAEAASTDTRRLYNDLEQTQLALDARTITSPVDGTVMRVAPAHAGEILTAGSAVAVIGPKALRPNPVPEL
jgi:multidrug resistance efflux pump